MSAKGKRPAFPKNDANLGGAHMILSDYYSFHERVAATGPTMGVVGGLLSGGARKGSKPRSMAERLSYNRAIKRAAADSTPARHIANMHHLSRRIEDMYSATERHKNHQDPTAHPVRQTQAVSHHRPYIHDQLLEPWKEGYSYSVLSVHPRPGSAPAGRTTRQRGGDHYQGWSVTNSLRDTFWGDDFPLTRYKQSTVRDREGLEIDVYRKAMMNDIVTSRLYKERDLKQLFKTYLTRAPLHDKQVVEKVVAELKQELMVV